MQTYNPTLIEKGLKATFFEELSGQEKKSYVPMIASVVPSNGASETYAWIGEAPAMQELVADTPVMVPMSDAKYTITNKTWTATIAVRRQDLEDDQLGGHSMRIKQLAASAVQHKNKLLIDALINGGTSDNKSYDGVSFYSDTHPARGSSGTQDNNLAGTGTSQAQISADLNSAIAAMMNFRAENGEPFHADITDLVIVAPPALRKVFMEILQMNLNPDRLSAQIAGLNLKLLVTPRLADTNDWHLLNVGGAVRPLILQDRVPITFESQESDSESSFLKEQYLYKVRARYNVGYSFWQHAIRVVN